MFFLRTGDRLHVNTVLHAWFDLEREHRRLFPSLTLFAGLITEGKPSENAGCFVKKGQLREGKRGQLC